MRGWLDGQNDRSGAQDLAELAVRFGMLEVFLRHDDIDGDGGRACTLELADDLAVHAAGVGRASVACQLEMGDGFLAHRHHDDAWIRGMSRSNGAVEEVFQQPLGPDEGGISEGQRRDDGGTQGAEKGAAKQGCSGHAMDCTWLPERKLVRVPQWRRAQKNRGARRPPEMTSQL